MRKIALLSVMAWGCSSSALPPSNVIFLDGHESDLWTVDPALARIEVNLVTGDQRTLLGQAPAPTSGLSVDSNSLPLGAFANFEAVAFDNHDAVSARGSTVTFYLDQTAALSVPVFVARSRGWSRPPGVLEHPHRKPAVVSALHQYVIAAGGEPLPGIDGSVPDFYDVGTWTTLPSEPALPRAPKSAGVVANQLLLIDETGASWLDLGSEVVTAAMAPDGLTFAEIAGGQAVEMADGTLFIVGATRSTGDPTSKVLQVGTDGTLHALALVTPRLGAAAGAVGDKLVIAGGSAAGAGVEVLNATQSAFVTLGVAADATTGLGLAALDATTMLLAGGKDPTTGAPAQVRTLDVSCGAVCTASDLGPMPIALRDARVFLPAASDLLVTGESDDGETHAFSLTTGAAVATIAELPLRERRKGASPVIMANGQVALIGGVSADAAETAITSIEAFAP